ncbi:MAG: hypothetical protein LBQ22_07015 [Bacteroidales bacterium]|jgi:hypothetical protein|nr:hypothetical protein [Bacteroidales bacterium]
MQREIEQYNEKDFSGRNLRLFKEWKQIDQRCQDDKRIGYSVLKRNNVNLPVAYEIIFNIKSITGVGEKDEQGLQKPIFGDKHILHINLPNGFPAVSGFPEFMFKTKIWHPNIRYFGDFQGRVCLNLTDHGVYTPLADYLDRIVDYLQYDDYYASNEYPYPEDLRVAEWVITQAEPNNWLEF